MIRKILTALTLYLGAYGVAEATVNERLAAHLDRMSEPRIIQVGERVHWALFYDYSNFGFIEGETALIAVDCGWWPGAVKPAADAVKEKTGKEVEYILYTHGHGDHLGGCSGIADQDAVTIIANEHYERYRDEMVSSRLPFIARRANDQMGFLLPRGPEGSVGAGVGPGFYNGEAAYFPPTELVPPLSDLEIDGVRIQFTPAPSDIDDAVAIFLPDERILFPGDAIIGTGPVVATPRQERGRDPYLWMNTLDALAELPFDAVLPGHGPAYLSRDDALAVMVKARDTIQFIVDHVVRGLNAKITREEIVSSLKLPPELATDEDLGWFYHPLEWVARGVYTNFAGWYTDDTRDLFEIDPAVEARQLVEDLGGRNAAFSLARNHLKAGRTAYAGRLLSTLHRADPSDGEVREHLGNALQSEAFSSESTSLRNYLLMEAFSLEDRYDRSKARPFVDVFSLLNSVPTRRILENLTPRLSADIDPSLDSTLSVYVDDRDEYFTLQIRNGVLRVVDGLEVPSAPRVDLKGADLVRFALRAISAREALEAEIFASDEPEAVRLFFDNLTSGY